MPRLAPIPCYLCERLRDLGKLDPLHIPDLGDGTENEHYRLCCKDGCHPTRWEARREAKQERKAREELTRWITQTKQKETE